MRPRYWRGIGGVPRRSTLASAVAYATAREGIASIVALTSARGGLVTTFWNRGTVAAPALERLSPWEWLEASYGGIDIDDLFGVLDGGGALGWEEGAGLYAEGAIIAAMRDEVPRPYRVFNTTADISVDLDTPTDGAALTIGAGMFGMLGGVFRVSGSLKVGLTSARGFDEIADVVFGTGQSYTGTPQRLSLSLGAYNLAPTSASMSASLETDVDTYSHISYPGDTLLPPGSRRLIIGVVPGGAETPRLTLSRST